MTEKSAPGPRLHLALVLLSAALIAFQLEQMQLLALLQWYHFAYFVISVALLGFGAAGTCLAIWREFLLRHLERLLPLLMFACALLMALTLPLSRDLFSAFDFSLLFVDPAQTGILLLCQLLFLLVFFLGALPLGLVFVRHSSRLGGLYCANLIGSGLGGIAAVLLMYLLPPQELPAWTALLPWSAGLLVVPLRRPWLLLAGVLALAGIGAALSLPAAVTPSPYKAISRTLALPGAELKASRPSPLGLVQLVTGPAMRHAPGLSLSFAGEVPELQGAVFSNGDWFGPVPGATTATQDASAAALPYALASREKVLVLAAGTGTDIPHALANGAGEVMAVEPHRRAVATTALAGGIAPAPFADPAVRWSFRDPRTGLAMNRDRFDLIILPDAGSFGGGAGLFALQENYLLTLEGMQALWQHLRPDGVIRVSAWLDLPPRTSLRLAATIAEALTAAGASFVSHVAAVRGWDMVTFVVKRSPLTATDIRQIRSFCAQLQFDPLFLPDLAPAERVRYHHAPQEDFFRLFDAVTQPGPRADLYDRYPFNLQPVNDNHPFFSQFLRWRSIPHLASLLGEHRMPFLELGYFLVVAGCCQMALAAVLLILLPLLRLGRPGANGVLRWPLPFFSGLGLGYMFFEMVLIHELVLFLGHPIFAAAAVIGTLLFFSGLGSLTAGRFERIRGRHGPAAALVTLVLLIYSVALPPLLHGAIAWPEPGKVALLIALIAPAAFVMGMPFPLGLQRLAEASKTQAAWAWGINGSVSVASTGLATIIAVEAGFPAVMLIACGAYGLAALSGWKS